MNIPAEIKVNGKWRPTRNSEGRLIHPTPEGLLSFWKWFGESKVVDGQGRPLVVYHGTVTDFTIFRRAESGMVGSGIYFAPSKEDASAYATTREGARVINGYLKVANPKIFKSSKEGVDAFFSSLDNYNGHGADMEVTRLNIKAGYDGVIVGDDKGGIREIVVFNPTQIKSATGNRGTFDGADPVMTNPRRRRLK